MSKFSGKCDFYDTITMYSMTDILNAKIYINNHKIKFEKEADLIPYYPYIIAMMSSSKKDDGLNNLVIHLSNQSYIDGYEKQCLSQKIRYIVKFLRSNKYSEKTFTEYNNHIKDKAIDLDRELFDIVLRTQFYKKPISLDYYKDITRINNFIDNECNYIHTPTCQFFRKELLTEAVSKGYNKCYNYNEEKAFLETHNDDNYLTSPLLDDVWKKYYIDKKIKYE